MSHPRKRRWFRISLKSLLGISILSGVFVAWVSNSYKQYQFEQELIETVASDMPRSSMMNLSVNGQHMSPFNAM